MRETFGKSKSLGESLGIGKRLLERFCDSKRLGRRLGERSVVRSWVKSLVRCWVKRVAKGLERLGEMLYDTFDERFGIRLGDDSLAAFWSLLRPCFLSDAI